MNNYNIFHNQSQCEPSNPLDVLKLAPDPLIFLELNKDEILFKLTEEMGYSEEKASLKFEAMKEMIDCLKSLRTSKAQTFDFLDETIKRLPVKSKTFIINFVLLSIILNDSYCHAYNSLAHFANPDQIIPITNKYIPETKLRALIEGEKTPALLMLPERGTVQENPNVFDETLLNSLYLAFDHYIWEHTTHVTFMNWFRVNPVGKPVFKDKMTAYFCYTLGKIENRMIESYRPKNLNRWIKPLINGNNYSVMKKRVADNKKIAEIDQKLSLF